MKYFEEQSGETPEKALAILREGMRRSKTPHPILECHLGKPLVKMSYTADYFEKVKTAIGKSKILEGTVDYAIVRGAEENIYIFVCNGRAR